MDLVGPREYSREKTDCCLSLLMHKKTCMIPIVTQQFWCKLLFFCFDFRSLFFAYLSEETDVMFVIPDAATVLILLLKRRYADWLR